MNEFHYTGYVQEIIFGAGALARLADLIEPFGWRLSLLHTRDLIETSKGNHHVQTANTRCASHHLRRF